MSAVLGELLVMILEGKGIFIGCAGVGIGTISLFWVTTDRLVANGAI